MEEERLKRDAQGKASALLSCSGSESEGEEVKSQFHCKGDEVMMEENPNPEDLEEDDDSDDDEETDDEDEETDDDDDDVTKGVCDKVSLLEDDSSDQGDGDDCPICLNRLKYQDIGTPESCDHSFCLDCIQLWARNVNTCPVDRREFELILARHAGEDEIFKKIPVAEKSFEAEEDAGEAENDLTYCEVCGQSNREDRLLLCDGCDLGFHCECLDPPLDSVPVEEWFCPDCAEANDSHRCVLNDFEYEPQYLLEENSPSEALPYLRPRRRQIARTRISERVRARIQEYREGLARLVCDDKDSGAFERGSTSTELSRTRSQTRQSEASKKQSTRRKSKRLASGKKKVLSRRKQQRRAKTLKKNQILDRLCNTTKSPKSRLAGKLGLTKSRKSERTTAEQVAKENLYGIKPLSIMGHKHELDQFDEDDSFGRSSEPQASTSMLSAAASKRSSKYSASALLSRQPVARPLLCKLPDDKANSSLFSCQSSSSGASNSSSGVGGAGLDLLGTIMMEQSILHMKSKDIKINRDGSLTAKKPVPVSVEECQSKPSQLHFDYSTSKEDENSKIQVDNDSEKNLESPEEENSTTSVASPQSKNDHELEKIHNSSSESKEERSPVASGESEPEAKVSEPEEEEEVETECSETVDENLACVNEEEEAEEEEGEKEEEEDEREEDMGEEEECKGNVSDDTKINNNNNNKSVGDESQEETEDSSQDGVLDAATVSNNSDGEDIKSASPDTEMNSQLYKSDDSCAAENNKEITEPEMENTYDPILEEKTISEVDSVGFSPELDLEQQSEAEDTAPIKEGESSCEDASSVNVDSERNKVESESIGEQQEDSDEDEGCPDEVDKSDKEEDAKQTGETSDIEDNIKSAEEDVDEEVPEEECKFDTEDDNAQKESTVDELESSVDFDKADSHKDLAADDQPSKEMSPLDNFEKSESVRDEESDENVDSGVAGENLVSDEPTSKKFEIIEEMSDHFDDATSTNMTDLEKVYQESSENYEETNEMVEKEASGSESEASSVAEGEREGDKPKVPISELPRIPKRSRRELYKREKSSRSDGPELKSVLGRVDMSDYKMKRGWGKKDRKSRWDPDDWNQSERDLDFISSRDRKSDGNKSYHSDRSESSHESEKYGFEYKESRSRKKRHDISRSHSKSHKESTVDYRDIPHCRYSPEKSKTRKRERSRNHSRSCSRDKVFDYDKSSKRKSRGRSRDKSPGRKSKRHRSYSRSPSRKSHKDRGLSDKRRHRDERKRVEDRVHKRYSDRLEYEEKKNRHHPEEFEEWDDGSCQVIDYPVEQNESPPTTKSERSKKSSDRFYKTSPNDKVSENFFEKRPSQERSAFKGNKVDDTGHFYNARSTTKKQKFVDRFYKAPHLRDAGTEKFPIHLSEDETEAEPTASKPETEEVQKSNDDENQVKENETDSGNSEYDPAFPTESGSPMRREEAPQLLEKVEEESTPALSESESSSAPCTTIEDTSPTCTQAVVASDPPFILQENPSVQNLPVQSQNITFPMGLRMMPPNMPQHLMMNPMFLSRPPPFGRLPRMAGPVNRMGWPMNPSGMMQLPPNRFGPARMGPGGAMPPRPGLLNGGFESMSQEPGQPMSSFKQHPCDPRHLPSQTHSPGQISRTGLPTPPNISHIPPPGPLLTQQHPPPPPPTSQMHMPLPTTSLATTSSQSLNLELDDGQSPASVHLPQHQQQSLGTIGISKAQPSSEKSLPPNFIVPEMNQLTKLLEAQAQLAMLAEDGSKSEGKQRNKQPSISQNSDIDVFKIPLPPMAPPTIPPPALALQLMPPPDSLTFSTNTTSTTNNSVTTNTFSNSNSSSNNISSSNNNNSSSGGGGGSSSSSSSNTTSNNVKVYKSHQLKLSNSHRSSEPPSESTEVVDMDVASPLDDDVEIELPASPELDDIDDSKLSSKDSSVIELSVVEDMPASAVELTNLTNKEKHASRLAKGNRKTCQQRTLSPTSTKVSYMGYMKKLQIQERVVDEVKLAIKPFYSGKKIDKNEYKEILRKAVPKICHSKSGNINPAKIKALIEAYVDKLCKTRRCLERRKKSSVKANGERVKKPSR
ncbi:protein SCAF11 isoform X1 [Octopus sinensis]|uniref:Protein SCAF11 isoform X1 n=1 Tax=Octopus sinensis TaxID=2607531 RepID=A0A6P7T171_9MOLL|nr:protein SCAF11 isoform X1 [Octopus sinensis]